MCDDLKCGVEFRGANGKASLTDFTVIRQRRVVRSISSAELRGLVDNVEQVLLLQCALHQIYCGTVQAPDSMIDLLERGLMYPPLGYLHRCWGSVRRHCGNGRWRICRVNIKVAPDLRQGHDDSRPYRDMLLGRCPRYGCGWFD